MNTCSSNHGKTLNHILFVLSIENKDDNINKKRRTQIMDGQTARDNYA